MDLVVTLITILAGIVAILGFLYLLVIGQKSLSEWWRERQGKHEASLAPATPQKLEPPAIPSNLPPRSEFIGREKEKARVREALASRWPLTCIDGIGGIGKTALALEAASECLRASKGEISAGSIPTFDGFIWTTAKDRELALNDVLDAIARTLDYPGIAQQPLEEKQESVRKLLQSKRYLLIVDNFETVTDEAVRDFLLRLPEPSKALITSREQKLRQAWAVSLKGLEQAEALALIRSEGRRLGLAAVEKGEEQVLLRLYQATGGAPLAIKWAVGQIKQKGQSLDTVLAALHEARGDIFEEVFARSWSLLSDDARRILMVMPIFAASASRDAIEAASDMHHFALDEGLGQLVEMWLVEVTDDLDASKRRYSVHPLTRAFAGARLVEGVDWEKEARERAAEYFLEYARKHGGFESWETYDELEKERENILAVVRWCYEHGSDKNKVARKLWQMVPDFAKAMCDFLRVRRYWDERLDLCQHAAEVAEALGDWRSLSWRALDTGWGYRKRGELSKAEQWVNKSLAAMEHTADIRGITWCKRLLGLIARDRKEYERARSLLTEALTSAQKSGKEEDVVLFEISLGNLACIESDYKNAAQWYQSALETGKNLELKGWAVRGLADIELKSAKWAKAEQLFTEGLAISQKVGRVDQIASFKAGLAKTLEMLGDHKQALLLAQEALAVYQRLGMQQETIEAEALVARLEGKLPADR